MEVSTSIPSNSDISEICIIIPTYNNEQTIAQVIDDVSIYHNHIIIINDGSTDNTAAILENYNQHHVISYMDNKGKGYALQKGFQLAIDKGYKYAITIDSDGQHYAKDIPAFINAAIVNAGCMIIGARNMNQDNVPGKSSFGNKFSNFWFWAETGIKLPDTQSGYRLYPLETIKSMSFFTRKYEFEIEAPVRIAWKHIPVISIPIAVYYPPAQERVTHFRPFKDFVRISILNTVLFFTAILWIHPRNFILKLFKRNGWKEIWKQIFVHPEESNHYKALSLGFGVFMGIVPLWGFQLLIGIPLAIFFKLNKALFLLAANISIFPFTPLFWALSLWVGKWVLGYKDWTFKWQDISLEQFKEAGVAFFLGGAILAISLGLIAYAISFILLRLFRKDTNTLTSLP